MTETTLQKPQRTAFLSNIPMIWIQVAIFTVAIIAVGLTYWSGYSAVVAEAAAEGEELDFELEDVYIGWSWVYLGFMMAQSLLIGLRRGLPFASTIQIALIIMLIATILMVGQQIDRDIYEVGILAIIVLTLIQVPFGNIPPGANFVNSMLGVALGFAIIGGVIAFSIWIVPYLIELG